MIDEIPNIIVTTPLGFETSPHWFVRTGQMTQAEIDAAIATARAVREELERQAAED